MSSCTRERFLEDIKDHSMDVIGDDGVNRRLSFSNNGSSVYWFEIITWPGALCISGDCGTYVFRRLHDMFDFFRKDEINTCYWAGKLESIDKVRGCKQFSAELLNQAIKEQFETWDFDSTEQKATVWTDVKSEVLSYRDNEDCFLAVAVDYKSDYGHSFDYFDQSETEAYTFGYIWCLEAIVYAIKQYDDYVAELKTDAINLEFTLTIEEVKELSELIMIAGDLDKADESWASKEQHIMAEKVEQSISTALSAQAKKTK